MRFEKGFVVPIIILVLGLAIALSGSLLIYLNQKTESETSLDEQKSNSEKCPDGILRSVGQNTAVVVFYSLFLEGNMKKLSERDIGELPLKSLNFVQPGDRFIGQTRCQRMTTRRFSGVQIFEAYERPWDGFQFRVRRTGAR